MSDAPVSERNVLGIVGKIFLSGFLLIFLAFGVFFAREAFKDGFPGWAELAFLVFFLLFFMGIPGLMLVVIWLAKPVGDQPQPLAPDRSVTEAANDRGKGAAFALVFGALFVLGGIVVGGFFSLPVWKELLELRHYVPTPATVISSEVKTHSGDSTTYSVLIRYRYRVDGQEFESDRFCLMNVSSSGYADKARTVKRYPPGKQFTCYVSPTQPGLAVINNRWDWSYLLTGVPVVFVLIGTGVILSRNKLFSSTPVGVPPMPANLASGSPMLLQPKHTPGGQFIGTLIFALIWNGITGVLVWQFFKDSGSSGPPWFIALFFVPFILIGLGLIVAVIYSGAAMWNPRFELRQIGPATLGLPLRLEWRCLGSTHRLAGLRMVLVGQEVQIYTSGSGKNQSTRQERSMFHRQVLVNTEDRHHFARGMIEVPLPAEGAMPTLEGLYCRIEWRLEFSARIRRWPDVSAEYPLTVTPFPAGVRP